MGNTYPKVVCAFHLVLARRYLVDVVYFASTSGLVCVGCVRPVPYLTDYSVAKARLRTANSICKYRATSLQGTSLPPILMNMQRIGLSPKIGTSSYPGITWNS